ncbi:MAG: ribosome-associated translation inhibitor RaiA [Firmicutes bacterium]|jgi:putative sigma-54 modulation protein|nr:ribosome-associated translation inhibitor RaiA [Bacillota bacterium]
MRIKITGKNMKVGDNLTKLVNQKFEKLDKYFGDDVEMAVKVFQQKEKQGVEATIFSKGTIFRAENVAVDVTTALDRVSEKLSSQMAKYKTRLQKRYKGSGQAADIRFEEIPDEPEAPAADELKEVKRKSFDIKPMSVEEAILQMELIGHSFFVFINLETEAVNVVYKRSDDKYGLLEPNY